MEYVIPDVPLECLQTLVRLAFLEADPDATFVDPEPVEPEAEKSASIGK